MATIVTKGTLPARKSIIDEYDANTIYVGRAVPGADKAAAVWQIKKIIINGTVTEVFWADNNDRYDNIWNNRTTLSYS